MTSFVYALIDPRTQEARYVGVTSRTLHRRLRIHISESYSLKFHRHKWIQKLLNEGVEPTMIVLHEYDSRDEAYTDEDFWIQYMKFVGCDLTNEVPGGLGGNKVRWTPEKRAEHSKLLTGHKKTAATRKRMSITALGRKRFYREDGSVGWDHSKKDM